MKLNALPLKLNSLIAKNYVKLSKNCVVDSLEYSGDLELEDGCMIKELIKIA